MHHDVSDQPLLRHTGLRLFALSLLALFLELLMIRWTPTQIRLIAYYANLMLISSFLGLGLGAMLARRRWGLGRFFLPVMLVLILLIIQVRPSGFGAGESEARFFAGSDHALSLLILIEIFLLNTAMFVPLGEQVGVLFESMPRLGAYTWDLGGSLVGTLLFAAFSLTAFSPPAGFGAVLLLNLLLVPRGWLKLTIIGTCAIGSLLLWTDERRATWSSYHYITVHNPWGRLATEPETQFRTRPDPLYYQVRINQDFYQYHGTLDPARYRPNSMFKNFLDDHRGGYLLPYAGRAPNERVLVLGAGGGLDVEAALLSGAAAVDAVEIDRALIDISRRMSPSAVYDSPTVHVHIDDARAFLQRSGEPYDVVTYGTLDSQRLSSYGSSVRQDGYVYTVEGFRRAFSLLKSSGVMSVAFSVPYPWVGEKLEQMLKQATGVTPVSYTRNALRIMLVPRTGSDAQLPKEFEGFERDPPVRSHSATPLATDDWPYLYLKERTIPWDYLLVIGILLAIAAAAVHALRQRSGLTGTDAHFFFLGMGFLLLQTKAIGDCSLYFGTTWLVSMIAICGTLLMVLAANVVAMRLTQARRSFYLPLFVSLLVLALMPRQTILAQPLLARLLWALLVMPLPIFFAGLIFSTTFRPVPHASAAFGANLIGATVGGFCEYLAMLIGASALFYIVFGAYAASLFCVAKQSRR